MTLNQNLRYAVLTGLFLVPFVGFLVASSLFFPYITGKNITFRILIEIIAVLYTILAVRDKNYRPKKSTLLYAFSAFIIVIFVADCFGIYPYKSFFSNFERMEGFITHIHLFVYFLILSATVKTEELWERIMQTSVVASILMGFEGVNQLSKGETRIDSFLGNSSYLGVYMLLNIFFALYLLIKYIQRAKTATSKVWATIIYAAIGLFQLIILFYSGTRGSALGLFFGFVFIAICFAIWEKEYKPFRYAGIALITAIVIIFGLAFAMKNTSTVKDSPELSRFTALATSNISAYASTQGAARFAIWGIAWDGVKERPILGWGQDTFNYVFNMHYNPSIYDQEQWFDRAHDVFLDWLIAGGVIGLLAYLSLYGATIYLVWFRKEKNPFLFEEKVIFTGTLIGYFIHNLFVFDSLTSYILFFTLLGYIHWKSNMPKEIAAHGTKADLAPLPPQPLSQNQQTTYILVVSLIAVVVFYYGALAPYLNAKDLIQALSDGQQDSDQAVLMSLQDFKNALSYDALGTAETREQLIEKGAAVAVDTTLATSTKQVFTTYAVAQIKDQIAATPLDARYPLFYGSYLSSIGDQPDAVTYFKQALKLSPGKQTILFALGQAYIEENDFTDALTYYKQAFVEAPSYEEARISYILAAIYAGQDALADQLRAPIVNTDSGTDIRIMKAYYDTNQSPKVLALLQEKLNIAAADAKAGNKDGAVSEIQQVEQVDPGFKTEGDAYIQQIEGQGSTTSASTTATTSLK